MEVINVPYKQFHEQFMTNLNGTSFTETFAVVTPSSFSLLLIGLLAVRNGKSAHCVKLRDYWMEFVTIVIPIVLSFTVCADNIVQMTVALFSVCFIFVVYTILDVGLDTNAKNFLHLPMYCGRRSFVTVFRGLISLLTAVCILAVDFTAFPRRFAKTETFGYSLMDTGVGLFCISNSIVPSGTLQRKKDSFYSLFKKTVISCVPLVILGGIRFFTVRHIDYQMHVSEYGVHWNFFLTLAASKLLCSIIVHYCDGQYLHLVSFVIIAIHEILMRSGVQDWVFSDIPRNNFLNANREGILSLMGYVALFIAGVSIQNLIFSVSPEVISSIFLDVKLIFLSVFFWGITYYFSNYLNTSRRIANFGYFIWIITFTLSVLAILITIDLLILTFQFYSKSKEDNKLSQIYVRQVPVIFESVNYNGLAFFLLANICTGLINISIQTLTVSTTYSVFVIILYMFFICIIMYFLFTNNIRLKIW